MALQERTSAFATIEEALEDFRAGKFVVVVDAPERENEGDLTIAAEFATPEAVNFMATHGRGVICLCLTEERIEALNLRLLASEHDSRHGTAYTTTIDAREGISTGVSAADRAHTIQVAIDPASGPHDLIEGGHMLPLRARPGGVLERMGQTEAAVDLARLAGLTPAGVVCEVMKDDGTMARVPDLVPYCERHGLKMITVADLVEYRRRTEKLVERTAQVRLPTEHGEFTAIAYRERLTGRPHLALVKGAVEGKDDVLVRVHSECLTGDIFASLRCDCGPQLNASLDRIQEEGRGVVVYLRGHEGRGIGLLSKLRAYELQERGRDTLDANLELGLPADARDYGAGAQILEDLGVRSLRLMTNNPDKTDALVRHGLKVTGREPMPVQAGEHNLRYLRTKRDRMGHDLPWLDAVPASTCNNQ
jgi:3,4-dihydroxy 2-butanone 4-phosphate synthase / GTP cyclohydrolase II